VKWKRPPIGKAFLIFAEVFVEVFFLWALVGMDFLFIGIRRILHALNDAGLERVSLFEEFVHAF
jgi:hypothetical protein